MWIFDQPDGSARLLRSREGHFQNPTKIRFRSTNFQDETHDILSCSNDQSFRKFSLIRDHQCQELSQGKGISKKAKKYAVKTEELKLPPIVDFDMNDIREKDWDGVLTCHLNSNHAHTWNLPNNRIGEYDFVSIGKNNLSNNRKSQQNDEDDSNDESDILERTTLKIKENAWNSNNIDPIKCVVVSTCGNFALLGTANGRIDMYNLQSGFYRGSFWDKERLPQKDKQQQKQQPRAAHNSTIQGLATDVINRYLISGSLDGHLKVSILHLRLSIYLPLLPYHTIPYHRRLIFSFLILLVLGFCHSTFESIN